MYRVSAQDVDERMLNVQYYYHYLLRSIRKQVLMLVCMKPFADLSVWFPFSVRLTRVTQRTNTTIVGVVQLFKNNEWNYICGTFFDDVDAGVVCRKMGYSHYRALPAGALGSVYFYRNVAGGVNCTGTESSLGRCPLQMGACSNRNRLNYGAVICSKVTIPRGECMKYGKLKESISLYEKSKLMLRNDRYCVKLILCASAKLFEIAKL